MLQGLSSLSALSLKAKKRDPGNEVGRKRLVLGLFNGKRKLPNRPNGKFRWDRRVPFTKFLQVYKIMGECKCKW